MGRPKVRQFLEVVPPTPLTMPVASNAETDPAPGGHEIVFPIQGCDPRVVLMIALWVQRASDSGGPSGEGQDAGSGVTWTAYSAIRGADKTLHALSPMPHVFQKAVRPDDPWLDGVLQGGDSAEISSCTPLLIAIHLASTWETVPFAERQTLWFSVLAFPSDAIAEFGPGEFEESYRGLLEQIRVGIPEPLRVPSQVTE